MVTFLVVLAGVGAGLLLLASDGRSLEGALAFAAPGAPANDVAPPPNLPPLPPAIVSDAPAAIVAPALDGQAPSANANAAPGTPRRVARPARRVHRAQASSDDAFRRATRVGRSRL